MSDAAEGDHLANPPQNLPDWNYKHIGFLTWEDIETHCRANSADRPYTYVVESILRNHKPVEPFCVTVDHPIMERWDAADPTKIKKINGSEKKYHLEGLLKVLNAQQLIREEIKRQYMKETGASEGTFNKLFREAQLKPDIEPCEDGKKWKTITPEKAEENKHEQAQVEEKGAEVQQ